MIKTLKKVGNSNAIILDKALMELVGLRQDGSVQVRVHGGSIILTPTDPVPVSKDRFQATLDDVVKRRRDVLERLAQ